MTSLSRYRSWILLALGFYPPHGERARPFRLGPLRGHVSTEFRQLLAPIVSEALGTGFRSQGKVIHRDRHKTSLLYSSPPFPFPLYVKHYVRNDLLQDIKDRLRGSQASKAFALSLELERRLVATPAVLAVVERWERGIRKEGFLICRGYPEGVPAARLLKQLYGLNDREDFSRALKAFGEFVAGIERAGIRHGCLMSALVALPGSGGTPVYAVTDLEQLCTLDAINDHDCLRMAQDMKRDLLKVPEGFLEALYQEGRRAGSRILQSRVFGG
ncbi:MAG: hypothetical protein AB1640_12460 [bacterium]